MDNKKTIILLSISILIVIIATAGVTFAYLSVSKTQSEVNVLNSACFNIEFNSENNINYIGYPMSSASAFKRTPYSFTITNTCENPTSTHYQVILNVLKSTDDALLSHINYSLDGQTVAKLTALKETTLSPELIADPATVKTSYILKEGDLGSASASATYKLYLWIDENACNGNECEETIMKKAFASQISVYSEAK